MSKLIDIIAVVFIILAGALSALDEITLGEHLIASILAVIYQRTGRHE